MKIKYLLTRYYEVDDTNANVKSVTVTWPCLFQLTTQLAQDANVTKGSIVIVRINTYEPLANVAYLTQTTQRSNSTKLYVVPLANVS